MGLGIPMKKQEKNEPKTIVKLRNRLYIVGGRPGEVLRRERRQQKNTGSFRKKGVFYELKR